VFALQTGACNCTLHSMREFRESVSVQRAVRCGEKIWWPATGMYFTKGLCLPVAEGRKLGDGSRGLRRIRALHACGSY